MELRQLRYFVAVAQELHFGRAAEQLHISGPALSQQILALERELEVQLFIRDRRTVRLTAAGRSLLGDSRQILAMAEGAGRRARNQAAETSPLRLGYVSWLPEDVHALVGPTVALHIDDWVLPSHAQADRVAEGSLDLALAWITAEGAAERGLIAHLVRAEPLPATLRGVSTAEPIAAADLTVLVDSDVSAWSSWNRYAEEFVAHTGGRVAKISDGGIAGEAFYAHVRRLNTPVLTSPKRHKAVVPPSLGLRPVADPVPLWTWSILHRIDDDRTSVAHVVESLLAFARSRHWVLAPSDPWWLPDDDPHRAVIRCGD